MSQTGALFTEPVLPMADIQGIAVPGFLKPHQTLLGTVCKGRPQSIQAFKNFVHSIAGEIATAAQTLEDRRQFREKKTGKTPSVLTALAFSYHGLSKLTPGALAIPSAAFQQGLAAQFRLPGRSDGPN